MEPKRPRDSMCEALRDSVREYPGRACSILRRREIRANPRIWRVAHLPCDRLSADHCGETVILEQAFRGKARRPLDCINKYI